MSILLQINNLHKAYDIAPLFDDLTLSISSDQHIGVVGRNGAGKSTLFKIIMGEEAADSGSVNIHKNTRIGYLHQQKNAFELSETILDFLLRSSPKESWECAKLAAQFGITQKQLEQPIGSFSGGYHMRINILSLLLNDPNLLLLDEPTNYLDLSTLLLLEQWLQTFPGTFLLISHDREFLHRTCKQTLEIANGKAFYYPQPIEAYLAYKVQQEEFARRYNKKLEKEQRHLQSFVDRFRYKASKASQAQSKLKQLEKLQTKTMHISTPQSGPRIYIPDMLEKKGVALSVKDLSIGYPEKILATNIHFDITRGEHVAIVGNNGQGKTTLLKTIAGVLNPLEGKCNFAKGITVGYYAQHVPDMLVVTEQLQTYLARMAGGTANQQDLYEMAGNFLFRQDDLKKNIGMLSGGEKARLCLAGLLLQKNDMLLLDEPTNHLDFETVEALANALADSRMTILFVSHNRTFVNTIATSIIEVGGGKVVRSHHDYENYVYHLKEQLHIQEKIIATPPKQKIELKLARIEVQKILKEEKKLLRDTELEMMELEKEKQDLLHWFEKNTDTFSRLKQDAFQDVTQKLQAAEEQWFVRQEYIQELEVELHGLR